ncbi:MAG TPA: ribonuclease H-like domain-containing protein [Flavisolibacter sp.]|nr:ribonuclease H-like domain-containing protein [Flavisolibacter sp.]
MNFNNILFLDIETVSQYETYNHLPDDWKELWDLKAQIINRGREEETSETVYHKAGIYAEFGKIVCISCGCIQGSGEDKKLVLKSFYGDDEKKLLLEFADMLQKWSGDPDKKLCAHNGKEFDYPYISRRMIINSVEIPEALKIAGKKPWELTRLLDTMELWKFGDFKSYTSLKLLARVFDIPSPKDDIDGSMVNTVYWIERDTERIVEYCQKDVLTLAQVLLRFHCEPLIKTQNIEYKTIRKADV